MLLLHAMKLLIAVALLVVGLSPSPGFSQFGEGSGQTTDALTEAPTDATTQSPTEALTDATTEALTDATTEATTESDRVDNVLINYSYENVYIFIFFGNSFDKDFYQLFNHDTPCFLNQLVFRKTNTNEIFQTEYMGSCKHFDGFVIRITMNPRDHLKLILDEFIDTNSTTPLGLEMYTADMLGAPFNLRIEPENAIECDVRLSLSSYVGIIDTDYWIDEGILLIHIYSFIDVATVNPSKLSLSRNNYRDASNTVNIMGGEILNRSPGLTSSVAIRLTASDQDLLTSKGICTGGNKSFNYDCYLSIKSGFAAAYFGAEVYPTRYRGYSVNNIQRAPTDSEPVTMSIQLEYVDGLTLNLTLGLGQPFNVRQSNFALGERIISVTCTSRDTNEHVNPMLEIDNGAVPIPSSYIQNNWPSSTTLNAPRGLVESGLQGYYTCRTEGDTFLSPHILHSNYFYIFFYQGSSATADVHEDIVLRFAHDDLYDSQFANFGNRFYVLNAADRYNEVPFDYHFEINTPFPYHAELHINRTQFDYEGEYFIAYDYYSLGPHFIIDVNEPELTLYPPVLTVLSSGTPDTTASLTCTSDNTNVPVLFSGNYSLMGITSTYLDDTNSSVRLDFDLDKDLIGMLEGMEFTCEARDPDDFNSTVSTSSSTFREVSAPLSLFAIEPDSDRKQLMDGAMINTASSFECLWHINPTRTDIKSIPGTLLWRTNHLETKVEMEFTSDVSGKDFIATTLENGITLNILGDFLGSVSCIYGDDSVNINVATKG